MNEGSFGGSSYKVTAKVTYRGVDFVYDEYELTFSDGSKKWLEYCENQATLWETPYAHHSIIKTTDNKAVQFDLEKGLIVEGKGSGDVEEGDNFLLDGRNARVLESEDVTVTFSNTTDMNAGEEMWFIDLDVSGELHGIEIYEDGTLEISRGRKVSTSDFPWVKNAANDTSSLNFSKSKPVNKAANVASIGVLIILLIFACKSSVFGEDTQTKFCTDCSKICIDKQVGNLSNGTETINCGECNRICERDANMRYTGYQDDYYGTRDYGRSYGGK